MIDIFEKKNLLKTFWKANYGIEKENIRVDGEGKLSGKPHPKIFGSKLTNPYITTDFGESQMEFITPVCNTLEEMLDFLINIESTAQEVIGDEYLWPQSTPPHLPARDEDIAIASYDGSHKGVEAERYREKLAERYGRKKQMLCGIHYNFSFDDAVLKVLYREISCGETYESFKNSIYLKLSRNFFVYRWLLIYLFGASPLVHGSYSDKCIERLRKTDGDAYTFNQSTSFRNGKCGYRNRVEEFVPYDTLENYIGKIDELIESGSIQSEKEYYSPLRLKSKNGTLKKLREEGIAYLELRLLDINPLVKSGIDIETLYFIQAFLYYMAFMPEEKYNEEVMDISNKNHYMTACSGLKKDIYIYNTDGELEAFQSKALSFVDSMRDFYEKYGIMTATLKKAMNNAEKAIKNPKLTLSGRLLEMIDGESFIDFHMKRAKEYKKEFLEKPYALLSYEDLELSTQIILKECIKRGIKFYVLDRKANFVKLQKNNRIEYIKQATKTSLDTYISILIMENKLVSKDILDENGVRTPKGYSFDNTDDALSLYYKMDKKAIVIKPNNTNFGIGISIFKEYPSYELYKEAVEMAFSEDNTILIEEFVSGKEYRFLVIGDEVAGVLHRVPANVVGNGRDTIEKLVEEKNKNPLRGKGYVSPLEKLRLGRSEEVFLKAQGLDASYVPSEGEIVYLRENSNISTGGDSVDYTDEVDESYKVEAIKATQSVGARICGVDMMIENIGEVRRENNYAIIEVNFNPAIHIHSYPYKGKNRKIAEKILKLLEFIGDE
jgi:glutamate--cysteine ligase